MRTTTTAPAAIPNDCIKAPATRRTKKTAQHLRLAEVVNFPSKERAEINEELMFLLRAAAGGHIKGISYVTTSPDGRTTVGTCGAHKDPAVAIGKLFCAATVLVDAM